MRVICALLFVAIGCGGGTTAVGDGGPGTGGFEASVGGAGGVMTGTGGVGGQSPAAPTILSLTSNVTKLDPNETLIITAVVTHPAGIAQVIGGQLTDPTSGGTYGAFQVSTTAGSYSLTLTWSAIQQVETTASTDSNGTARLFRAQFFDQAGHMTTKDLTITLWCGQGSAQGICAGTCTDLDQPTSCGSCEHDCLTLVTNAPTPTCTAGKCGYLQVKVTTPQSCTAACAASNWTCVPQTNTSFASYSGSCDTVLTACATVPAATNSCGVGVPQLFSSELCYCTE
jgi:hypothetical protein